MRETIQWALVYCVHRINDKADAIGSAHLWWSFYQ